MKLKVFGFLLFVINGLIGQDRIIKGIVLDSRNQPVQGVSITARYPDSSNILAFAISRPDGKFSVKVLPPGVEKLILEFRHISFESKTVVLDNMGQVLSKDLIIALLDNATELKEILIKREVPVLIRSDTVVFNANSYRDAEVRKVEDLLRKMQGFSVDPNGRLSFNGRPVEKVLIDGDDLADKSYQMITKNLDAITIDKVEVINNFSDNRLLRNITETNKVGVNLKISSEFQSKISGGVEIGTSYNRRYSADYNTIYLEKRLKWLFFGNYNSIARDPSGNVRYSFEQEGGRTYGGENGAVGSLILEQGGFVMPSIGERYTRDNSDFGLAVMNSWRIGDHVRFHGMVGYDDLSSANRAGSLVLTEISDQEKWSVNNEMNVRNRGSDLVARISMQQDNGKKHVTRIDLSVNGGEQKNRFSNLTNGDVIDSLMEKLSNRLKEIRFNWQETFLLGKSVLQLNFNFDRGNYDQEMNIRSSRYLSYWSLDSSYIFNHQALASRKDHYQVLLKVNRKTERLQYEYGVRSEYRVLNYLSDAMISSSASKPDFAAGNLSLDTRDLIFKGTFRIGFTTGKKGWLGISGESGWEALTTRSERIGFITFNAGLGYSKSYSLLNSFRINYKLGRGFKEYDKFYPDELISGNGMILNGLNFKGPEFSHGVVASLNSNNINKQRNWSVNLSYMMMPLRYTGGIDAYPEYSLHYFELNHNNNLLNMGVNWEGYIRTIRGKLGGLVRFNSGRYESSVNQVKGNSVRSGLQMEGWWVSGFQMPVNAELKGVVSYSAGRWDQGELNRNWQYHLSYKLKFKTARAFYSALVWSVHKLSAQQLFHGMDLFASFRLNPALLFTLTGTNLFNMVRVVERTVMPYSMSESNFGLVERYLLFSVNWNF